MKQINGVYYEYLGDGAYVSFQPGDGGIWLLANDHLNPTDRIYVEFRGIDALNAWITNVAEAEKAKKEREMADEEARKADEELGRAVESIFCGSRLCDDCNRVVEVEPYSKVGQPGMVVCTVCGHLMDDTRRR